FVGACEAAMDEDTSARVERVDGLLAETSWDRTWRQMSDLIEEVSSARRDVVSVRAGAVATPSDVAGRAARADAAASFAGGD
ncbi:MAG: hypothetical protein M3379_11235, partial [Acidobacteriota bacterium]|nr:hypothetical protein [Acidobacteriota bacterium]